MEKFELLNALNAEVDKLKDDRKRLALFAMDVTSILGDITEILNCQDNGDLDEVYNDFHCVIIDIDYPEEDEDE